jgi:hypothetical protein
MHARKLGFVDEMFHILHGTRVMAGPANADDGDVFTQLGSASAGASVMFKNLF